MLYGTIIGNRHGFELHVSGYPHILYIGYSLREAKKKYRREHFLEYEKIRWEGNVSCCT